MARSFLRALASMTAVTLAATALAGCGGAFEGEGESGGAAGSGGQAGGGGGRAGSGGSGGGGGSCKFNGSTYADGETFPAGDGCNTCTCNEGEVGCTLLACTEGCFYEGNFYDYGQTFPAGDGCNTCECQQDGTVGCTAIGCTVCSDVSDAYGLAMDEAKTCDPNQTGQCSKPITEGLNCGCTTFVNPENSEAIEAVHAAQDDWSALSCGGDVVCGACASPSGAYCSAEGRCETVWGASGDASCQVDGVVYPSGSSDVPDPFSCNTCSCENGELTGCSENDCPSECPPNSVQGTQCAQCGADDGCEVVDHACLPVCNDTCDEGACVDGVCKSFCG